MLQQAEARLHPQDHGPIDTLFASSDDAGVRLLENPAEAIATLLARYPDAETVQLHPADVPFFTGTKISIYTQESGPIGDFTAVAGCLVGLRPLREGRTVKSLLLFRS